MAARESAVGGETGGGCGSATVRTPADYTLKEALQAYGREQAAKKEDGKKANVETKVKAY